MIKRETDYTTGQPLPPGRYPVVVTGYRVTKTDDKYYVDLRFDTLVNVDGIPAGVYRNVYTYANSIRMPIMQDHGATSNGGLQDMAMVRAEMFQASQTAWLKERGFTDADLARYDGVIDFADAVTNERWWEFLGAVVEVEYDESKSNGRCYVRRLHPIDPTVKYQVSYENPASRYYVTQADPDYQWDLNGSTR